MENLMDFFRIHIDGEQFKPAYLVYVVRVRLSDGAEYFYVGQTGDRHYKAARPAFRRLAAHFDEQGSSTQNQIYRGLAARVLGVDTTAKAPFQPGLREDMAVFLSSTQIDMFAFPMHEFLSDASRTKHQEQVRRVEQIEQAAIRILASTYGADSVLNKRIDTREPDENSLSAARQIIESVTSAK